MRVYKSLQNLYMWPHPLFLLIILIHYTRIKWVSWEYSCVEEHFVKFLRYSLLLAVLPRNWFDPCTVWSLTLEFFRGQEHKYLLPSDLTSFLENMYIKRLLVVVTLTFDFRDLWEYWFRAEYMWYSASEAELSVLPLTWSTK